VPVRSGKAFGRRKHVTPSARRVLFIFAHQDDEYSAAPWILEEIAAGSAVACLYLTDGGNSAYPSVRDAESQNVLSALGVPDEHIVFLGRGGRRIRDQDLPAHCREALNMIDQWIEDAAFAPQRIYAPSYEGGHPDHDAAHLVAALVALKHSVVDEAWHFALYNAYACPKPFFSTLRQLPSDKDYRRVPMSFGRRLSLALLCRRYRSQWRTWLGLFPGAIVERVILGRESVVRFDVSRLNRPPHMGELLYERRFGVKYDDFARTLGKIPELTG